MIKAIVIRFASVFVAVMILPYVVPGITIGLMVDAIVVAIVLGFFNVFIKPILRLVSTPVRWITLGLFSFIINGALLWLVAELVEGFTIVGFPEAVVGAFIISVISLFTRLVFGGKRC